MSSPLFDWFVPCPRGLEAPLAAELTEIGERHVASAPLSGGGSLIVGAQVPDRSEPDGFRWSHAHWTRIEQSEEVEEVDELTFYRAVDRFLERPER